MLLQLVRDQRLVVDVSDLLVDTDTLTDICVCSTCIVLHSPGSSNTHAFADHRLKVASVSLLVNPFP